ncbi:MAG: sugar ABC transporter permease, partial [Christensenellales bacterium]
MEESIGSATTVGKRRKPWTKGDYALVVMASMGAVWLFVFCYLPMAGIVLAFKDGDQKLNIFSALFSPGWTLNNFTMLFKDKTFWQVFANTITINLLFLLFNFPAPIIFALLMNEVKNRVFKTSVQTICNFPHFMSWVVYG